MSKIKIDFSSSSDSDSEVSFTSSSSSTSINSKPKSKSSKKSSSKYSDSFSSESIELSPRKSKAESYESDENTESNSLLNLQQEYEPPLKLPLKVYKSLQSIKKSMLNLYELKKKFKENLSKIKEYVIQTRELQNENEKLADLMIEECLGCIALSQVVYGSSNWRYAKAYIELALVYLEFKNLPKQAKEHCEKAWEILYEELKNRALHESNKSEYQESNFLPLNTENINRQQMMLNYIFGRSCTILKENKKGESVLKKCEEFFENWIFDLAEKKLRIKYKEEIKEWRLKIYFALAKQYAINTSNGNALEYYDKCIDCLKKEKTDKLDVLIEVHTDKAKIEILKENYHKSVDMVKECLQKVEEIGSEYYVLECKLALAKIFSEVDDMNSSSKAEELYQQVLVGFSKNSFLNEKQVQVKEEFVKFYLKQEKYEESFQLLESLLKDKTEIYGDYHTKLNSTHKLICSIYLKRSDLTNAVKHLQKSLEIEELNYGKKSKKFQKTNETFENLQAQIRPKSDKPVFNPTRKVNHYKQDMAIYSNN